MQFCGKEHICLEESQFKVKQTFLERNGLIPTDIALTMRFYILTINEVEEDGAWVTVFDERYFIKPDVINELLYKYDSEFCGDVLIE